MKSMAGDHGLGDEALNPCCAELKKKFNDVKEGRNALRKAVKLLQEQVEKVETGNRLLSNEKVRLESENHQLKKAYEEERERRQQATEIRVAESGLQVKMEKEIEDLKAEISLFHQNGGPSTIGIENNLLQCQILQKEVEIKRVRELLEKEKKRFTAEKRKAEAEKSKSAEAAKKIEFEKNKAEEQRRRAESEKKNAEEYRILLGKAKDEALKAREKLMVERSKADDANKRAELMEVKVNQEKDCADTERKRAEEQKRLTEIEMKKVMDEKARADCLSKKLEKEGQIRDELHKKLELAVSYSSVQGGCWGKNGRSDSCKGADTTVVNLLKWQLKLEKQKAKHNKRMVKFQKAEKSIIRRELHHLKQDFGNALSRFNMLDGYLSCCMEGTDGPVKNSLSGGPSQLQGISSEDEPFSSKKCRLTSSHDSELRNIDALKLTKASSDIGLTGGRYPRLVSGTNSEFDSPAGVSISKKQSSAVCSTSSSFSDGKFLGSQGRDAFAICINNKLGKDSNQRSTITKSSLGVDKVIVSKGIGLASKNTDESGVQKDRENMPLSYAAEATNYIMKKRKIHESLESLEWTYSEYNRMHLRNGKELNPQGSNCFNKERDVLGEKELHSFSPSFESNGDLISDNQEKSWLQSFHKSNGLNQADDVTTKHTATLPSFGKFFKCTEIGENIHSDMDQLNKDIDTKHDTFFSFEDMVCGDVLRLLDLDNEDDEKRYRRAVQMPLSPTLPNVEYIGIQDNSLYLIGDLDRTVGNEKEGSSIDIMALEIASNTVVSNVSDCSLPTHSVKRQESASMSQCCIEQDGTQHENAHKNGSMDIGRISNFELVDNFIDNMGGNELDQLHRKNISAVDSILFPETISYSTTNKDSASRDSLLAYGNATQRHVTSEAQLKTSYEDAGNFYTSKNHCRNNQNCTFPKSVKLKEPLLCNQALDDSSTENQSGGNIIDGGLSSAKARKEKLILDDQLRCSTNVDSSRKLNKASSSTSMDVEYSCQANCISELQKTSYCVLFPNTKDEVSISRTIHARKAFLGNEFIFSKINIIVNEMARCLALEEDLQPREKTSVFFTCLLCNISSRLPEASECYEAESCLRFIGSFTTELHEVISDKESRNFFHGICKLDILVLAEDFLIGKEVLLYMGEDMWNPCISTGNYSRLGRENFYVSSATATLDQFLSGCIILATVCAACNQIDFILQACYKILRYSGNESFWNLSMLHVFASICGEKFFDMGRYSFLVPAIKSLVLLLENEGTSRSSLPPCPSSALKTRCRFFLNEGCPFTNNAVSVDKLMPFLLDVLHYCALNVTECPDGRELLLTHIYKLGELHGLEAEIAGWNLECDSSCFMVNSKDVLPVHSDSMFGNTLCFFADTASIVELIVCNMSWESVCDNVISRLICTLKLCVVDGFSAVLYVLIGQLARFGINNVGYRQSGVLELGNALSAIFETNIISKKELSTQIAAAYTLSLFLPLGLEEIFGKTTTCKGTQSSIAETLQRWFAKLCEDQQAFSRDLLICFESSKS